MGDRCVFVTGGTGFVGMNAAQLLLEKGYSVVQYARKCPPDAYIEELKRLPGRIIFEQGDVLDQEHMEAVLRKYKAAYFIHGAAITPDRKMEEKNPLLIMEINCMGLLKAALSAKNSGVRRFLYLGSISAYGETALREKALDEETSVAQPYSLYELSKFTGERLLLRLKNLYGMDAAVARIGDVYGPWERYTGDRGHMSLIYQTTARAMKGESSILPGDCLQDWVYAPDLAKEILSLMETEKLNYDVYPLCSGRQWKLTEWCELLRKEYPGFSYRLAAYPGEETVQVNQASENAAMSLKRLSEDTGYRP